MPPEKEVWIEVFGRLHPLVLHLPVGLIVGLVLYEALASARRRPPAPLFFVGLAAFSAALAAASGWVLHEEPGYGGPTLERHEWLGISTAAAALMAFGLRLARRERGYRITLLLALAVLAPASHFGATMTHGAGFVLEPLRRAREAETAPVLPPEQEELPEPEASEPDASGSTYAGEIAPILAAYCVSCHGEEKQKYELRLDTPEHILAGSRDGAVLVPGDVAASTLVTRALLPIDDFDHMPPDHKPQPTAGELALLEAWVAAGAPFEEAFEVAALPADPPPAAPSAPAPAAVGPEPTPAPAEALAALRARLAHAQPVAEGEELYWIDFSAPAASIEDEDVRELLWPLREHVADLSLARTAITDAALRVVASMPRLRRLDLSRTAVTGAGLAELAGHAELRELVLVGARLSDDAVDALLELPALERAWLWRSGLDPAAVERLRAERPELAVEAGDAPDAAALELEGELAFTSDAPVPGAEETAEPSAADLRPTNASCPVSGAPVDPRYAVVFEGRVIGFCCPECPKQFWADPERFRAATR